MEKIVLQNESRTTGPKFDQWPAELPQISYVMADGEFICVTCANRGNGSEASLEASDNQWKIIGAQVNPTDTICSHCNRTILASKSLGN